jgi:hypothetical protein
LVGTDAADLWAVSGRLDVAVVTSQHGFDDRLLLDLAARPQGRSCRLP